MNVLLLLLYKLILDILYAEYISDIWSFRFASTWSGLYIGGWIVYIIFIVLIKAVFLRNYNYEKNIKEYILFFLIIFSLVPGISMCGWGGASEDYIMIFLEYWLFFVLCMYFALRIKLNNKHINAYISEKNKIRLFYLAAWMCVFSILFVFFYYGNGKIFFSSLISEDVYNVRLSWRDIELSLPLNYILANATIVLLVIIMYLGELKRFYMAFLLMVVYYLHFSCGAQKSIILSLLICCLAYIMKRYLQFNRILSVMMCGIIFAMLAFTVADNIALLTFIRRTMFETNIISYYYNDFFSSNLPTVYSALGREGISFSEVPRIIGWVYYTHLDTSANNGLIGDAVAMFGTYGVIIEPLLWSIYLVLLGSVEEKLTLSMKVGIGLYWAITMQNSAVLTCMFSHGGIMLLLMAYCLPKITEKRA